MTAIPPAFALALLAATATAATADQDARRPPFAVRIGCELLNAETRDISSSRGWSAGGDLRLPVHGLLGSPHADADYRGNHGAAGAFDAFSVLYAERMAVDAGGTYVGGGLGLAVVRYAPGDEAPERAPGLTWGPAPASKVLVGHLWSNGLGVEAAYVATTPVHGVRTDAVLASLVWRFDARGWRR